MGVFLLLKKRTKTLQTLSYSTVYKIQNFSIRVFVPLHNIHYIITFYFIENVTELFAVGNEKFYKIVVSN